MNDVVRTVSVLLGTAALAFVVPGIGVLPAQDVVLDDDLIVVEIPAAAAPRLQDRDRLSTPLDRYVDGARIVRLNRSGTDPAVLTPEFAAACDPDVSFDGTTIVFAGRRLAGDAWQIWTMNADGSGKRQLTDGPGQRIAPVFAGARFYLDDAAPTPQIVFAARTAPDHDSFALYGTDLHGDTVHRLTFNPQSDFSPAVLPNGRVVFSSWQRFDDHLGPDGIFALQAVNLDGTDLMPFHGNHEPPRYRDMAAVDPTGDRVYFVESDRLLWLGGGRLAFVSWRRPLRSYQSFDRKSDDGVFHSPTPLPGGGLVASYRHASPDSVFAIYRLDPASGERAALLFANEDWHLIDAQVLAPRPPTRGRSNWLQPGATTGVLYCLDCYRTSLGEHPARSVAPRGTIKHVRVIEAEPQRIVGIAPVEDDGSFHIRVPAETPLTFQLLDEDYVAVRTQRAWTWVMGNENRGCIGCHEDRELSPPNRLVTAITKPAVNLAQPPNRRRTVDFRNQIAPIVAARCATAGCHIAGGVAPILGVIDGTTPDLRSAYTALLEPAGDGPYVVPGQARSSPLIRLLLGRDSTARADAASAHAHLDRRDVLRFIEWADLGAVWESGSHAEGSTP
jgi:hypothetical protein